MAKVKSAGLRNYVGRLGGNVYYVLKGQNISRELAPQVSNPKTPLQMRQRMKWANLVNIYKANLGWMGHLSFQDKKANWSDYNAFISANIGANPVYLTKQMAESGGVVLAPYTMTKGSLAPISYEYAVDIQGVYTDIVLSINPITATVGELAADIIANNDGWQNGDQLSIILMYRDSLLRPIVAPIEIILDTTDTNSLAEIDYMFGNLDELIHKSENDTLEILTANGTSYINTATCVVHSRTVAGKTYVSTQKFELSYDAVYDFREAGSDDAFNAAAESYGMGESYFLATGGDLRGRISGPIRLFSGTYQPDTLGEDVNFIITDGGQNTFKASVNDALDNTTHFTLRAFLPLTGADYSLYFSPTGGARVGIGTSMSPTLGGLLLTGSCTRTNALQVEDKAGVFELVDSDAYEDGQVIASWTVTL